MSPVSDPDFDTETLLVNVFYGKKLKAFNL
jgi:hypothetical protein